MLAELPHVAGTEAHGFDGVTRGAVVVLRKGRGGGGEIHKRMNRLIDKRDTKW